MAMNKMERLTFEGNFCDIARCEDTPGGSFCEYGYCDQRRVWERLKAYEDIGTVEEFAAYKQAESEGRLVEFASIAEKEERLDGYKFYYCASEDSYLLGYRVDNLYYARWHEPLGFVWEMSKYLPWGETISDESTDWKTHTYPSKPIEMGVNEWFNGFLNQRIKAALAAKEGERE